MKSFVILSALVAAAYAEADPALLYGGYGYAPYGYAGYPYALGKSAPCVNAANVPVPCADGYAAGVHLIGKRDADAEADPALLYGAYGYAGYAAYPYAYAGFPYAFGKSAPCVNAANVPVPCAGAHVIGKRDADADPALLYSAYGYPYNSAAYSAFPYTAAAVAAPAVATVAAAPAVATVAAAAPAVVAAPAATVVAANAYAGHAVAATPLGLTHSANVGVCTNYLGAQVPC